MQTFDDSRSERTHRLDAIKSHRRTGIGETRGVLATKVLACKLAKPAWLAFGDGDDCKI